jgi:subtilase family serine protease
VLEIDDLVLSQTGTYTIRAYDNGDDHTGRFTIGLSDQPISTPAALPALNTTVSGQISWMGDVDEYAFAGNAGQVVTVERTLGSSFDLTLIGPDNAAIAGEGVSDSRLHLVTLPTTGEYRVRIEAAGNNRASRLDDTGDYRFIIWAPNRNPDPILIGFGEVQAGQVDVQGDLVEFTFDVAAEHVGRPVSIVHSATSNFSRSSYDPVLELYRPDGSRVARRTGTHSTHVLEIDDFVLPAAGVYTIRAYENGHRYTGSFTIGLSDQPVEALWIELAGDNTTSTQFVIDGPGLVVTQVAAPTELIIGDPAEVDVSGTVENQGPAAGLVGTWTDRVLLSTDAVIGNGDDVQLGEFFHCGLLEPGENYTQTQTVTFPGNLTGTFFLYVRTDATNVAPEPDAEDNNTSALAEIDVTVPFADLVVEAVSAPASALSGDPIDLSWRVRNQGISQTNASSWVDRIVLSSDGVLDADDAELARFTRSGALAKDANYTASTTLDLPHGIGGDLHVFVVTDFNGQVFEHIHEDNNSGRTISPIAVTRKPDPDLQVTVVTAPGEAQPHQPVAVSWTVENAGPGLAESSWRDRVYLSTDGTLTGATLLATVDRSADLGSNASYDASASFTFPVVADGAYRIVVVTDQADDVFEGAFEDNNQRVSDGFQVTHPDLQPAVDSAPATATSGETVSLQWSVTNTGSGAANGEWIDRIYLSSDATLSADDRLLAERTHSGQPLSVSWTVKNQGIGLTSSSNWDDTVFLATDSAGQNTVRTLGSFTHNGPLAPDGFYQRTVDAAIPNGLTGTFFVVVTTGGPFEFIHTDNNRSVSALPVEISLTDPPDLVVSDITAPPEAFSGSRIDVTWTVRNEGSGAASGAWTDTVFMRLSGDPNAPLIPLGSFTFDQTVEPGTGYTRHEQLTVPAQTQGLFQVVVRTNANNALYEHGQTGNNTTTDDQTMLVELPDRPDLQVQSIIAPDEADAGGTATLEFIVINQGTVATSGRWSDKVWLSLDNQIGGDDVPIGTFDNGAALGPEETYKTTTDSFVVPRRFRGEVFLIVETDSNNQIEEFPQEENNILTWPIEIIPLPPADLVTSNVVAPDQTFEGSSIEVCYKVTNLGAGETDRDGWSDTIWLTRDKNRPHAKAGDILLRTVGHTGSLKVDESYEQAVTVSIPAQITGEWFITPWTDALDVVTEDTFDENINPDDPNELDNNNYKALPITILLTPPPDLVVTSVTPDASGHGGEPFSVSWTVENRGANATQENSWIDTIYLANAPTLEDATSRLRLARVLHSGALSPGASYEGSVTVDLTPAARGQHVIVVTGSGVWEGPFSDNNEHFAPTDVINSPADLVVRSITVPDQNFSGEKTTISWTVENVAEVMWHGTRYWSDEVWMSPDPTFIRSRATRLGSVAFSPSVPLQTGGTYTQTAEFTLPRGIGGKIDPKDFYVYVTTNLGGRTDFVHSRNEISRGYYQRHGFEDSSNNQGSTPIPVLYREPDLRVTDVVLPQTPPYSGETIPVTFTVTNIGTRDTRHGGWVDRVYLSSDPSLDFGDQMLGSFPRSGILQEGDSYQRTVNVALPDGVAGDFHVLVFTDSNLAGRLPPAESRIGYEFGIDRQMARVKEFQDEGNNITAAPLEVILSTPPDLQVTVLDVPERVTAGQTFELNYTVTNVGQGPTPARQNRWDDLFYLSRDEFLDLQSDRYLDFERHIGVLQPGEGYTVTQTLKAPNDLDGPFYVFVITDPPRRRPRGEVFEGPHEGNNATASSPQMVIDQPPPTDLQVQTIAIPGSARSGESIHLQWTVVNADDQTPAEGKWTDAVYLSEDAVWDVHDRLIGRVEIDQFRSPDALEPGETYTATLDAVLPPATPGQYRIIVRPDIFNEIYEGINEANNRTPSADTLEVTVDQLQLAVPLETTLSTGQQRLYRIEVELGQTLRVEISSDATEAANELFLRHCAVPTGVAFDAAYQGPLAPDQTVIIPATEPGTYFLLVRGHSEPTDNTPVTLFAEVLPLSIFNVSPDAGGDSRWVTTTILGAQFHDEAVVKLVRPGFAEYEPANYDVIDSTKIIATFDLRDAPHGLYDVKVVNPNGDEAVIPYRYLVERALETDVTIGMGGPRVLSPGDTGVYGVSVKSLTNVDTPYTFFEFGIPELGTNPDLNLPYLQFASNLRGAPPQGDLGDVPWASLDSAVNTTGEILAPGYVVDLPARQFAGRTFTALTYPGLAEILEENPEFLKPFTDECDKVAFQFHIAAAATALTREEFLQHQTDQALALREAILEDATASQALSVLAADPDAWVDLYLAALEDAGLIRPVDEAPPIREQPLVASLMATLATGVLAGPAGEQMITDGNLVGFFEQVRRWYGHDSDRIGSPAVLSLEDFDLGLSRPTHFEAFNIYVPFAKCELDVPPTVAVPPPQFGSFFTGDAAGEGRLATVVGPFGHGSEQFLPAAQRLPYTVHFENPQGAASAVSEVRVIAQLDSDLDPRTFRLGDIKLGEITVSSIWHSTRRGVCGQPPAAGRCWSSTRTAVRWSEALATA